MNKFLKVLNWTVVNFIFLALVIAATVFDVKNAGNVVIFLSIYLAVSSYCLKISEEFIKKRAEEGWLVNKYVSFFFCLVILSILVWHGWWITTIFYFSHISFSLSFREKVEARAKK